MNIHHPIFSNYLNSRFKFLIMTEKKIFVRELFSLNMSDFS